jgi:hypothetical protein
VCLAPRWESPSNRLGEAVSTNPFDDGCDNDAND